MTSDATGKSFNFGIQLILDPETAGGDGGCSIALEHKTKPLRCTDADGHGCFQAIEKNDWHGGKWLFSTVTALETGCDTQRRRGWYTQQWQWKNKHIVFTFHFSPAFAYCLKIQSQDCSCYGILMQSRRDILSVIENSLYCIVYNTSNNMNKPLFCVCVCFFSHLGPTAWETSCCSDCQKLRCV